MDILIGEGASFVRNKNGLSCVYLYVCAYAHMHIYMYATIIIKKRVGWLGMYSREGIGRCWRKYKKEEIDVILL